MNFLCLRNVAAVTAGLALVGWFWYRGEQFLAHNGPTFDEPVHLAAGYLYWTTGNFALNHEDPPLLKLLWALPLVLGDQSAYSADLTAEANNNHWHVGVAFMERSGKPPPELFAAPRRVNLALGCCVLLLAGWWAFRLWNSRLTGIGACAWAACDPNWLALSCVLTTDTGLTLFALLSCYLLWEYTAWPSRERLVALGVSLGLTLGSKLSAVGLVAGLGAAGAVYVARGARLALPGTPDAVPRIRAVLEFGVRLGLIAFLVLAATYGFVHFDQWARGLKFQLTRTAHGDGVMYLNGELSRTGWYHYFLVLLPLKLPLGLLVAVVLVACSGVLRSIPRRAFLLVPPVVFLALASYSRVNLGVRVVLPVMPFLYVIAGGLACVACCRAVGPLLLGVCLAWAAASALRADPEPISYFNELVDGPRRAIRYVADSNVDWGQGLPALRSYMHANGIEVVYLSYFGTDRPELYGIRYCPLPTYGRVGSPGGESVLSGTQRQVLVVSANNLLGIYLGDPTIFAWLRHREPTALLAGCLYVFDLTGDWEAVQRVHALAISPR